jgi:hypothetical protein
MQMYAHQFAYAARLRTGDSTSSVCVCNYKTHITIETPKPIC